MRRKTDDYEFEKHYGGFDNKCEHCQGSGNVDGDRCPACEGTGTEPGYDDEDD